VSFLIHAPFFILTSPKFMFWNFRTGLCFYDLIHRFFVLWLVGVLDFFHSSTILFLYITAKKMMRMDLARKRQGVWHS